MAINDGTYSRSRSKRKIQVDGVLPSSYLSSFPTCGHFASGNATVCPSDLTKNTSFLGNVLLCFAQGRCTMFFVER